MKISVVTPSIRPEMLGIVAKCLSRQTFKDFEWIYVGPKKCVDAYEKPFRNKEGGVSVKALSEKHGFKIVSLIEPNNSDHFYNLDKAWNEVVRWALGELFVSIVDGLWFPPETLERLWVNYRRDEMSCVGLVGNQYDQIENGKPEHCVWIDPRKRIETFYEIPPMDLELCIASLPLRGLKEIGGFDEEFDKFPAWGEKDVACRMAKIGYKYYLDQSVEYRAIYHPRLQGSKWDELYPASTAYFQKCYKEIQEGKRLKLDFL